MEAVAVLVLGGGLMLLFGALVRAAIRQHRAQQTNWAAQWSELAERLGGEAHAEGVRVEAEGSRVLMSPHPRGGDIVARAPYALGWGPVFHVFREGTAATLAKATIGLDDVEIGDPAFDREMIVQAPDPWEAKRVWTERARRIMMNAPGLRARSIGRHVEVRLHGPEHPVDDLETAVLLCIELAQCGLASFRQLGDMPEARYLPPVPGEYGRLLPRVELNMRSGMVQVTPIVRERAVHSCAALTSEQDLPDLNWARLQDGELLDPLPKAITLPEDRKLAEAVGRCAIARWGGAWRVMDATAWRFDPHFTRAAAQLLEVLADTTPREGAYR